MANQFMGLSLFIMLLSFFIILNSMSDFEETKAKPILSSLDMAFSSSAVDRKDVASSTQRQDQKDTQEGDTLDKIEGLFNAQVKDFTLSKNRLGTEMYVSLSVEEFEKFLGISSAGDLFVDNSMRDGFTGTLVSLIQTAETEIPYRMDMVLNIGGNPSSLQNEQPEKTRSALKQVSAYSKVLEDNGMPIQFMSAGLGENEENTVELLFRRYVPVRLGLLDEVE